MNAGVHWKIGEWGHTGNWTRCIVFVQMQVGKCLNIVSDTVQQRPLID